MTEEILLLPGANGTELIRMLARFQKNTLGLRIMNAAEFARFALMRSGIVLEENFLPRKQEAAVIDRFVQDVSYFESAGYADAEKIADALYSLRGLIPEKETETIHEQLPKGEFPEKNKSLELVYEKYLSALKVGRHVDTIGLLRKAIAEAKPVSCTIYTLQEYPLTPLENRLADCLAASRIHSCLPELLEVGDTTLKNVDYTESYGCANEVEAIYHYIVANKIPFDECTVAVANSAPYAQLFYDFARNHNLPITLGCGIPILNANPARVLKLLYTWNNSGYRGVDALKALLHSDALDQKKLLGVLGVKNNRQLDKVIGIAGQLRLGFEQSENEQKILALPTEGDDTEYYPAVRALSAELIQGESKWVEKYALIRDGEIGRVDRSALSVICDALDAYAKFSDGRPLDMITPQILKRAVCSENSREGALFVTSISGAIASMRKHLFIAGLSAGNFPGSPRENYLLLDSDYLLFGEASTVPTSNNLILRKKKMLENLLALAAALRVNTHISYSSYDTATLKAENPSSVLFEIFKQQHGAKATLQQYKDAFDRVGYFAQQVSGDYTIGNAYVQGKEITYTEAVGTEAACAYTKDTAFSPSALSVFFECPRKFFLTKVLGVEEEEEDDPFTVIDHLEIGNLAHELMKNLVSAPCDRDTFLQRAEDIFAQAMVLRPPLHPEVADAMKGEFLRMMANAYDEDPGNEVLTAEKEQIVRHSSGILLKGYPDRVEKIAEKVYIIADYKTGKKISHVQDDIDTCLQVVIYAYMMERQGKKISHCEYRYLRDGVPITCRYDADMEAKLDAKMQELKTALTTGQFPCATDKEACKYCKLGSICGKGLQEEELE